MADDYISINSSDYLDGNETVAPQLESDSKVIPLQIEEKIYGVNKPYRITIRAKVSHDKG